MPFYKLSNSAGLSVAVEADSIKQAAHWLQAHYAPSPEPPILWTVEKTTESSDCNAKEELERLTHAQIFRGADPKPSFDDWGDRRIALGIGVQPLWEIAIAGKRAGPAIKAIVFSRFGQTAWLAGFQKQRTAAGEIELELPATLAMRPWLSREESSDRIEFAPV